MRSPAARKAAGVIVHLTCNDMAEAAPARRAEGLIPFPFSLAQSLIAEAGAMGG